jgi:MFS superfamily sulfate permease-like transporter
MEIVHECGNRGPERVGAARRRPSRLKIYMLEGPLLLLLTDITERAKGWPELKLDALVLRLDRVDSIDMLGLLVLRRLMTVVAAVGIPVVLCGASVDVRSRLMDAGLHCFQDKVSYCDDISILL